MRENWLRESECLFALLDGVLWRKSGQGNPLSPKNAYIVYFCLLAGAYITPYIPKKIIDNSNDL